MMIPTNNQTKPATPGKHISSVLDSILSSYIKENNLPPRRTRRGRLAVPLDIVDNRSGLLERIFARFEIREIKRAERAGYMYYYGYSEDFEAVEPGEWPHYTLVHREAAGTDYFCFSRD